MQEYVTDAVVLNKEPLRELDGRYVFLTERFGKIAGKATSSRKITSKLSPHLEPGTVSRVRFVERNAPQIVDALTLARVRVAPHDLRALGNLLPEAQPEPALWDLLRSDRFSWRGALAVLGWDPLGAACMRCSSMAIAAFHVPRQDFFCANCASKLRRDEILLI